MPHLLRAALILILALPAFGVDLPTTLTLTSLSPPTGPSSGETHVTLTGANFTSDCVAIFGGVAATSTFRVNDTSINAITPAHAAGVVDVSLHCGTSTATLANAFTFLGDGPRLTAVKPAQGTIAGGTHVRITGERLHTSCWAFFDGVPGKRVIVESAASLVVFTPPHAAGAVAVSVRCSNGDASLADAFTYVAADDPKRFVTSSFPEMGAHGSLLTLFGRNFRPDDDVLFGSVRATIIESWPDRQIVEVPDAPIGPYTIDQGHFINLGRSNLVVSGVIPSTVAPGGEVDLIGSGILTSSRFVIGGQTATMVRRYSDGRAIIRLSPNTPEGQYRITDQGPILTVRNGPIVRAISPPCATTDGGIDVLIFGSNFAAGSVVKFGNHTASDVSLLDASRIRARVPDGDAGPVVVKVIAPDGWTATLTNAFRYVSPFDPDGACPSRARAVRH